LSLAGRQAAGQTTARLDFIGVFTITRKMKQAEDKPRWYYVDEAGDPNFYGKGKKFIVGTEGCSLTFSLGFLRTYDPQAIRSKLADVRLEVLADRYLKDIPSIIKSQRAFHAKDDCFWQVGLAHFGGLFWPTLKR
jgi:hypothetical protein